MNWTVVLSRSISLKKYILKKRAHENFDSITFDYYDYYVGLSYGPSLTKSNTFPKLYLCIYTKICKRLFIIRHNTQLVILNNKTIKQEIIIFFFTSIDQIDQDDVRRVLYLYGCRSPLGGV